MIVAGRWADLLKDGKALMSEAFAEGTWVNLRTQWKKFDKFCEYFELSIKFPFTAELLVAYITWLCTQLRAQNSVQNYVSGMKTFHVLKGFATDGFDDISVKLALKGAARRLHHTKKQAQPMTPTILYQLRQLLDLRTPMDATYWALFILSFVMFMRKSNMVPDSVKSFNPSKQLIRADFRLKNGNLMVHGKWSKVNQFGSRTGGIPVLAMDSVLCPVMAFKDMCTLVPGEGKDPAFCVMTGGVLRPITYRMFQQKLKSLVEAAGYNPADFSTHSFRRGGASLAYKAGISGETIKVLGDWKSNAYMEYLECPLVVKTKAAVQFTKVVVSELNQRL